MPDARPETHDTRRRTAWLALVVMAVAAWYGHAAWHRLRVDFHGNASGFIQLSREWYDDNPMVEDKPQIRETLLLLDGGGYDAQFMYYMAFDPFMRHFDSYRRIVDYPPYRFGRIGYVLLIKIFSGDRWRRFPETMLGLVIGGLVLSAAALGRLGINRSAGPLLGSLVLIIPGFWESLAADLPEPIAAALIVAGFWLLTKRATTRAAMCFALSLVIRETGVVFVALVAAGEFIAGRRRTSVQLLLLACLPLLAWRLYVTWAMFPIYGIGGLILQPHNFGLPFGGIIDSWRAIAAHDYYPGAPAMARAAITYSAIVIAAFGLAVVTAVRAPSPASIAAVAYALLAVSLTYDSVWGSVGGTARVTSEVFVALAIVTSSWRSLERPLKIGLGMFWAVSAAYVLFVAPNAEWVRQGAKFWAL